MTSSWSRWRCATPAVRFPATCCWPPGQANRGCWSGCSARLPLRVDLGADAEVEADRFEDDERGAGGVDVGGGEDAGVFLDDRRGGVVGLCVLVGLDPM